MRRWWWALIGAAMLALVPACGSARPYGVDGDLTDEWALPVEGPRFAPAADGCFDAMKDTDRLADYAPFDCGQRHAAEAFHAGMLQGEAAYETSLAAGVTIARSAAMTECVRRATTFLGADARTGALQVQPVLPAPAAWSAGSRWFRCDLAQVDIGTARVVSRTGSLRGALRGRGELTLGCFRPTVSRTSVEALTAVDCARPHDAEFAGLWTAPGHDRATSAAGPAVADGCRSVIAAWAGLPDDDNLKYRVGYLSFAPAPDDWELGVRTVQCFLWMEKKAMTGSYRDAGSRKLPVNYG